MARSLRPIGHDERLSLVDHLDELRTRLIICLAALTVAFAVCFWQNHALLHLINKPLVEQTQKQVKKGNGVNGQTALAQQAELKLAAANEKLDAELAGDAHTDATTRAALLANIAATREAVAAIPLVPQGDKPVTLGVGEPFTTTLTVTLIFALIASLPVILYELYGFILPAFSPNEKRIALPLMLAIPFLFIIGAAFGYFVVLPAAVRFFQNFNSSEFNVLVQAAPYYKFAATIILVMGLVFQVPVAILGATRAGIVSPKTLAKHRRYAIVLCAAVAAFLPGDAITLILETVPLYLLFELSVFLARVVERRENKRAARAAAAAAAQAQSVGVPSGPTFTAATAIDPNVQQIIDHTDPNL